MIDSLLLDTDHLRRYARHLSLPEIGEEGQARLMAASVLVIGAGGLGATALAYLAAGGVGRIGVVDGDRVELSNLHRQILYETADIGRPKAQAARDRLEEMNPDARILHHNETLTEENARRLLRGYDLVLDGTDNFETRFVIADTCFNEQKPLVSASVIGWQGQLSTFKAYLGDPHPCYRCLVATQPEACGSCAEEGVIGPLAGIMGALQALAAMKELLGIGASLSGALLLVDGLALTFRKVVLKRDPLCAVCG